MWFDIPILAYRSTAVPETLGDAALMFTDKGDLHAVAAMASLLLSDRTLRQRLINAQRRRRAQFLPEQIRPLVFHFARAAIAEQRCTTRSPAPMNAQIEDRNATVGHLQAVWEALAMDDPLWAILLVAGKNRAQMEIE